MFCEESLGKVNLKDLELFGNRLVHKFYCLKVVITLEQVLEKKKNLNEQNFDQIGADGVAIKLVGCCKLSLNISFSAMTKMTCDVHHFFALWQ